MIEWRDYIDRRDDTAAGKPVLKGTRFAVSILMEYFAGGETIESMVEKFEGQLTREQLVAALLFAAEVLENIKSDEAMPPKVKPKEFWEGPEWEDIGDYLRVREIPKACQGHSEDHPEESERHERANPMAGR